MSDYRPPNLQPLNIADIIDASVRLYRRNFGPFLSIIAIVYAPMAVFQVILAYSIGGMTQTMPENPDQLPLEQMAGLGIGYIGLLLLNVLAVPISQGALAVAVSRRYLNYPASVRDAYGAIGLRWGQLIATVLLVGLVVVAGTMLCIVPGIYLAVMWIFVTPIIAIEGLGGINAMKRSWDLVSGEWWRCFSTYFLLSMLVGLVAGMVTWPVTGLAMALGGERHVALAQALSTGVSTVAAIIVQPVAITGLVLLYYDLRIRKEGFDLQVLARAMDVPEDQLDAYESTVKVEEPQPQADPLRPLWDYVAQARSAGMGYDETREQLLQAGWPAEQVEANLASAWTAAEMSP